MGFTIASKIAIVYICIVYTVQVYDIHAKNAKMVYINIIIAQFYTFALQNVVLSII